MKEYITAPITDPAYLIPLNTREQPKLLAELFCNLTSFDQAKFFDRVAEIDRDHWQRKGIFQWRHMQDDLTEQARQVIVDIYEHTSEEE